MFYRDIKLETTRIAFKSAKCSNCPYIVITITKEIHKKKTGKTLKVDSNKSRAHNKKQ